MSPASPPGGGAFLCSAPWAVGFFLLNQAPKAAAAATHVVEWHNYNSASTGWFLKITPIYIRGLPRWHSSKESACPGSGRSPNEGNSNPLQYLAWTIPWIEEPGGLQSMGLQRARYDLKQLLKGYRFPLSSERIYDKKSRWASLDFKTSTVKLSNSLLFQGGPSMKKNSLWNFIMAPIPTAKL